MDNILEYVHLDGSIDEVTVGSVRDVECVWGMLSRVLFHSERRYGGMFVVLHVPFVCAYGLAAFRNCLYMYDKCVERVG